MLGRPVEGHQRGKRPHLIVLVARVGDAGGRGHSPNGLACRSRSRNHQPHHHRQTLGWPQPAA